MDIWKVDNRDWEVPAFAKVGRHWAWSGSGSCRNFDEPLQPQLVLLDYQPQGQIPISAFQQSCLCWRCKGHCHPQLSWASTFSFNSEFLSIKMHCYNQDLMKLIPLLSSFHCWKCNYRTLVLSSHIYGHNS